MTKLSGGAGADMVEKMMRNSVPLGRQGTKEEIAAAAIFLVLNKYISGQVLVGVHVMRCV